MHFLFALAFMAIGVGMGLWARSSAKKAKAAQAWPKVAGVVTESRVDQRRETGGGEGGREMNYSPIVRYEYEVAGVKHTGDHIGVGGGQPTYASPVPARKAIADYPVGKAIEVLVDPANPANAALTPKATVNMVLPAILTVVGVILLFVPF